VPSARSRERRGRDIGSGATADVVSGDGLEAGELKRCPVAFVWDAAASADLGAVTGRQAGDAGQLGWLGAAEVGEDEAAELTRLPGEPATALVSPTRISVGTLTLADSSSDVGPAAGVRTG